MQQRDLRLLPVLSHFKVAASRPREPPAYWCIWPYQKGYFSHDVEIIRCTSASSTIFSSFDCHTYIASTQPTRRLFPCPDTRTTSWLSSSYHLLIPSNGLPVQLLCLRAVVVVDLTDTNAGIIGPKRSWATREICDSATPSQWLSSLLRCMYSLVAVVLHRWENSYWLAIV